MQLQSYNCVFMKEELEQVTSSKYYPITLSAELPELSYVLSKKSGTWRTKEREREERVLKLNPAMQTGVLETGAQGCNNLYT